MEACSWAKTSGRSNYLVNLAAVYFPRGKAVRQARNGGIVRSAAGRQRRGIVPEVGRTLRRTTSIHPSPQPGHQPAARVALKLRKQIERAIYAGYTERGL